TGGSERPIGTTGPACLAGYDPHTPAANPHDLPVPSLVQPGRPSSSHSLGKGAGSNKVVVNPGTGALTQRRARPPPYDCTLPADASTSSARCTVRWLAPSASARPEVDHDSPSASKATTAACSPSTGGTITATSRARRGARANPRFVALTPATARSAARSRPTSTRNRARCEASASLAPKARARRVSRGASPGHASPSA